ncbi:MAG: hypothetical protein KAV43_04770 [Hadesarchaea archaeon]|nr:hypothetical protein [Hadesarchaea archaeon]
MSDVNFDKHYPKHCVRYYGWLPASKKYKKLAKKDSLKYFTLCAKQAIDVFMFESEKLLSRDAKRKLPNVIICENDIAAAAEILTLVRPPLSESIIVGELEEILTFRDTKETMGLSPDNDVRDRRIRRQLGIKRKFELLKKFFPFDIINFDTFGNFFNPPPNKNKLYASFSKIFELQQGVDTFLLFVTTPIYHIHPDSESILKRDFEFNVSSYQSIRDALKSSLGTTDYNRIAMEKKVAVGFAKSMVIPAARKKGWGYKHQGIFVYETPNRQKMLSSVIQFSKNSTTSDDSAYVKDIVHIINEMPKYYSYEASLKNGEVRTHLKHVIKYREKIRSEKFMVSQ